MKKDYSIKPKSPASAYPQLVKKLARLSVLAQDLHNELTSSSIGEVLGVEKQAIDYHKAKERKGK